MIRHLLIRMSLAVIAAGLIICLSNVSAVQALDIPPEPTDIPVVDQTGTFSDEQKNALAAKIATERTATNNQIAILMIPSLKGDALEDYSLRVARTWGIGSKERSSGVLVVIVKNDHLLRIEVGKGLEGALTDIRSGQIIRQRITPAFKAGNYYAGIDQGLDSIITAIHGETDTNLTASGNDTSASHVPWEFILFGSLLGFSWLASILGRTKSWWAGGIVGGVAGVIIGFLFGFLFIGIFSIVGLFLLGLLFDNIVSRNYALHARQGNRPSWWAGGSILGGGSGSGGGFGGFGGGGFSGGGSSGSW